MENTKLIESLSPIEKRTLKSIKEKDTSLEDICKETSQDNITVLRAAGLLEGKGLILKNSSTEDIAQLGILGVHYLKNKLPERALINKLDEKGVIPIGEIKNVCNLNDNEAKIGIGILKRRGIIEIKEGKVVRLPGELVSAKMPQEILLEKLPLPIKELSFQEMNVFKDLLARKELVEKETKKIVTLKLTTKGKEILCAGIEQTLLEQLTPKLIKQNGWKGKKFRRYDVSAPVPRLFGGKKHFVNQAKEYAKSIWIEMGFKEMAGNYVDTSFWIFDALFTAQDHPVREMQDTFYIKGISGNLPPESKTETMLSKVKKAHEGGIGQSKGWEYIWDPEDAKRVLLRTHTTGLSARMLKKIADTKEFPAKYFALGKCFRNETVDWSHGFEFNQTEGIVVDENANFRQLLGYLKQFFKKMGYEKIRIRPGYFAYTEPSLEIDVFHPIHKKWVELGGAGMFRPEVTIPMFGRHVPVLAWGPGFDRIIMEYFEIKDLRDMYKNDLTKLRNMKSWIK